MMKTYISALLVVLLAEVQMVQGQESLDDVFAQLNTVDGGTPAATASAAPAAQPATVSEAAPATVEAKAATADESAEAAEEATEEASSMEPNANVVDLLLDKGIDLYKDGQFNASIGVFDAVLSLDEYNKTAINYKKRAAQRVAVAEDVKRGATREEALAEVKSAWNESPKVVAPVQSVEANATSAEDNAAIQKMKDRLNGIQIKNLDFPDASLSDVLSFLRVASGGDVNILLRGMDASQADDTSVSLSIQNVSLSKALEYIAQVASLKVVIKPDSVCVMPSDYVPVEDMVSKTFDVSPTVGSDLESAANAGDEGSDDLFGDSSESESTGPANVASFFKGEVEFPEGASAVYRPRFHTLAVKNTPENLKLVSEILAQLEEKAMSELSQQVEIEAKFVEFSEGSLEELGFDWNTFGSGGNYVLDPNRIVSTPNSIQYDPLSGQAVPNLGNPPYGTPVPGTGQELLGNRNATPGQRIFSGSQRNNSQAFEAIKSGILASMGGTPAAMLFGNDQVQVQISAMQQEGTADVLSAPKVTTKSGVEAIIRVAETHRYPQDYDVETGQRTAPVVKPQDWEDFDLGVTLRVTPVVNPESNTIDLQLRPEITKFRGYDEYYVAQNAYDKGGDNSVDGGDGSKLYAKMPYFERRFIETEVTIADGHTVVMGGLVDEVTETFRDQVPILGDIPYLGRLFRTEGTRTSKRNLVIYVKATQVDANGMTHAQRQLVREAMANVE